MKDAFVNHSLNIIRSNKECDDIEIKKLKYGLEGLYSFVTKYTVIVLVNIFLNTFIEFFIFHIAYALIRSVGFGLHAKTNKGCWVVSLLVNISIPLLIKHVLIDKLYLIIVSIIAAIIIAIFAPADTKKRPLIHKNKRIQDKIIAIVICLVYILLIIYINNFFSYCITYALLFESIMVNPITYRLTKQSYNNYKNMNV